MRLSGAALLRFVRDHLLYHTEYVVARFAKGRAVSTECSACSLGFHPVFAAEANQQHLCTDQSCLLVSGKFSFLFMKSAGHVIVSICLETVLLIMSPLGS